MIISFMESNNLPVLLSKVLFKNRSKIIVSIRNNPNLTYIKYWANIKSIVDYFLYKLLTIQLLYRKAGKIITVSKGIEIPLKEYGIYTVMQGRVNICGLNDKNLSYVIDSIIKVADK